VIPDDQTQQGQADAAHITFSINWRLTLHPSEKYAGVWSARQSFVFDFEIVNPSVPQESPNITVSATGLCNRLMNRESDAPCCASCTTEGVAMPGHAAPLKIIEPLFCTKTAVQTTDFPCGSNTICVTLSANFPLKADETVITISNLQGLDRASGELQLSDCGTEGLDTYRQFSSSFTSASRGTGMWDNTNKLLQLFVKADTCCAGEVALGLVVNNPVDAQSAPTISVSAGPGRNATLILIYP